MEYVADSTVLRKISVETLSRVERNDPSLGNLVVTNLGGMRYAHSGQFWPIDDLSLLRLGGAIGCNSNLTSLSFHGRGINQLPGRLFFEGVKKNTSISHLDFLNCSFSHGLGLDLLNEYAENDILLSLRLQQCVLGNGNGGIGAVLSGRCKRLKKICISNCVLHSDILYQFMALTCLERLELPMNDLRRSGCKEIATLLRDPNSSLRYLDLHGNNIDNKGVVILANGLKGNKTLQVLDVSCNPATNGRRLDPFPKVLAKVLSKVLSNPSSIAKTYSSNHTLRVIRTARHDLPGSVSSLLSLNDDCSKSRVAMWKILRNHPHLDIDPLLEWDLKALPHVIAQFNQLGNDARHEVNVGARKLSVIYDFVKALPLQFVRQAGRVGGKRKRDEVI